MRERDRGTYGFRELPRETDRDFISREALEEHDIRVRRLLKDAALVGLHDIRVRSLLNKDGLVGLHRYGC